MNQFIEMLSPGLKNQVVNHIFMYAFDKSTLLKEHPDIIQIFLKEIMPHLRKPDDIVIEQGTVAEDFYFIAEGQCQVIITDLWDNEETFTKRLNIGDSFGELGLIFNCKRTATVKTTNYCTFAKIEKKMFMNMKKQFLTLMKN